LSRIAVGVLQYKITQSNVNCRADHHQSSNFPYQFFATAKICQYSYLI